MKIILYKFLAPNDNANEGGQDFYETRVLTESELRDEFLDRWEIDAFTKENLEYYNISTDDLSDADVENMDIATIVDCFNDNGNFSTDNIFLVEPITVDVEITE